MEINAPLIVAGIAFIFAGINSIYGGNLYLGIGFILIGVAQLPFSMVK